MFSNNLFTLLEIIFIYSLWYIVVIASMIVLSIVTIAWAIKEQVYGETNTIT